MSEPARPDDSSPGDLTPAAPPPDRTAATSIPSSHGGGSTNVERRTAYDHARSSLEKTLSRMRSGSDEERRQLGRELQALLDMSQKLADGVLDIVVFGEISTGKSALINALAGQDLASVDVQGGWTKEVGGVAWDACTYRLPGLAGSAVRLVDTPGLNEVGGEARAGLAREAAARADLILFVTDSDLNDTEFGALLQLASSHKPLIVVLNKIDQYTSEQRTRLIEVLTQERLKESLPEVPVVTTAADPRPIQYVIESADGSTREEWRKPRPDIERLKIKILEVLERDGLNLLALNAAMYAADKSDRLASLRVELRARQAAQTVMSFAILKAVTVALSPPIVDLLGGPAIDSLMVVTLARIYGLELNTAHARKLVKSIGLVTAGELVISFSSSLFKGLTGGLGIALTAVPQGAAAGFGSYIVGQAAKYYFEHGASWGESGPKQVVREILEQTDKQSVIDQLKDEIRRKLGTNPHARK